MNNHEQFMNMKHNGSLGIHLFRTVQFYGQWSVRSEQKDSFDVGGFFSKKSHAAKMQAQEFNKRKESLTPHCFGKILAILQDQSLWALLATQYGIRRAFFPVKSNIFCAPWTYTDALLCCVVLCKRSSLIQHQNRLSRFTPDLPLKVKASHFYNLETFSQCKQIVAFSVQEVSMKPFH